jgi:hypothetical protein
MADSRPSICVVGAGITGLVCAWELARKGFSVQVVEQHSTSGGMLASMRIGHEYIELLPHHIRKNDRSMISLLKELGLQDDLAWFDSYWYGRAGRKKLGYLERGFHCLISALSQEITDSGGLIHYGYTAMDISQCTPGDTPAVSPGMNASITSPSSAASSSAGSSVFSTAAPFSDHLGIRYQISCVLADCTTVTLEADTVLFTASCRNFAHITHNLSIPTDYRDALMDVTYKANMCLLLLMKSQFTGCFSRPISFESPFQRMIEHTNLIGARRYGGHVLYLSGSFTTSNPLWTQSDAEVFHAFFQNLQLINPAIVRSDILNWRLTRNRYATPTTRPGNQLLSPLPGLFVCSLAMVDDGGEDGSEYRMDPCVSLARQTARLIEQQFPEPLAKTAGSATIDRIF